MVPLHAFSDVPDDLAIAINLAGDPLGSKPIGVGYVNLRSDGIGDHDVDGGNSRLVPGHLPISRSGNQLQELDNGKGAKVSDELGEARARVDGNSPLANSKKSNTCLSKKASSAGTTGLPLVIVGNGKEELTTVSELFAAPLVVLGSKIVEPAGVPRERRIASRRECGSKNFFSDAPLHAGKESTD
jgi:hypothetical protein